MTVAEYVERAKARAGELGHEWDRRSLDWPLSRKSVVVEVGGYFGRWALQITERYHPRLYVFEPQPWACETCKALLGDAAVVCCYGLGDRDGAFPMGAWETDGCSFLKDGDHLAQMREIGGTFKGLGLKRIDLMMMNIEGYEYTLLPHMLDLGILPKRLMVQWHPFTEAQAQTGEAIVNRLADLGYVMPWSYGSVLMAWERTK